MWEENWQTVEIFLALSTQWRVIAGQGVVTQGIDYAAVPPTLALLGVKKRRRREVFNGLRIMERAALDTWYGKESA